MTTTTATSSIQLGSAAAILCGQLEQAVKTADRSSANIAHATVAIDKVDLLAWLDAQTVRPRMFWSGRDDQELQIAAVGIADEVRTDGLVDIGAVIHKIRSTVAGDKIRYFGGFRFDMGLEDPAEQWQEFSSARFVLPRVVLGRLDDQYTISANIALSHDNESFDEVIDEIVKLVNPPERKAMAIPQAWTRTDSPTEAGWENLLNSAMNVFAETDFRKIVLARKATLTSDQGDFEAVAVLRQVQKATSHCFHALFEFGDTAFISSSPEMLYRRDGRELVTEAIAGTRPRGENEETDRHFKRELSYSDKDLREHDYVAMGIEQSLRPMSESLTISDREVLQLPRLQHLHRRFKATLKESIGDADLLLRLHPTAAVGTFPTRDAAKLLAVFEPIDRGWYAGPIGWIGADAAEFAVAIRSGLVRMNNLMLYAGAGILEGSTAPAEWNEIEIKLGNFIKALT